MNGTTLRAVGVACLLLAIPVPAFSADPSPPKAPRAPEAPQAEKPVIVVRTPDGEQAFWIEHLLPARRAFIGVRLTSMTADLREHFGAPRDHGLLVTKVVPDSPAARAGLSAGDIVLALDDDPVGDITTFQRQVFERTPGDRVKLAILRDGRRRTLDVELGSIERRRLDLGRFAFSGEGNVDLEKFVEQMQKVAGSQQLRQIEIAPITIDEQRLERVIEQLRRRAETRAAADSEQTARSGQEDAESSARRQELERQRQELERRMRELERKIEQLERRLGER